MSGVAWRIDDPTLACGARIGAYRIDARLGAGGMCEVWAATHVLLGRRAAIKLLKSSLSRSREVVQRFFNEARAMTTIGHPAIAQIFDFGFHDDGRAYIAMELLDGETLDARVRRRGPCSIVGALHIVRQVASALAVAHAHGIVHRDLKPENIFLARDLEAGGERVKLLDFGIAKQLGTCAPRMTHESVVLGTPHFMSPEQCRDPGACGPASDVYSLGCVLFHLLTGRPPFAVDSATEAMAMHLYKAAPVPSAFVAGVPAAIDTLVARCLAKSPAARPTADDLAGAPTVAIARSHVVAFSLAAVLVSAMAWLAIVALSMLAV